MLAADTVLGVGTGSTVDLFLSAWAASHSTYAEYGAVPGDIQPELQLETINARWVWQLVELEVR